VAASSSKGSEKATDEKSGANSCNPSKKPRLASSTDDSLRYPGHPIVGHSSRHFSKVSGFAQLPLAILATLSDIGPEAHYRADSNGNYPVHLAAAYSSKDALLRILCSDPSLARQRSNAASSLALHAALANPAINNDLSTLKTVYDLYPEAVFQKDWRGHLPLHVAAMACETVPPHVFEWLVSLNPSALQETNVHGYTCLHLALDSCDTEPVIAPEVCVSSIEVHDACQQPPIAASMSASELHDKNRLELVKLCLQHGAQAEMLQSVNNTHGHADPIHAVHTHNHAAMAATDADAEEDDVDDSEVPSTPTPAAVTMVSQSLLEISAEEGELALHTACKNSFICADIVQLILDANPSAASVVNIDGNTPLHLAASRRCRDVGERKQQRIVLSLLLKAHPSSVAIKNLDDETPYSMYRSSIEDHPGTGTDTSTASVVLPFAPPSTPFSESMTDHDEDEVSMISGGDGDNESVSVVVAATGSAAVSGAAAAIGDRKRSRESCISIPTLLTAPDTLLQREIDATERMLLRADSTEDPQRLRDLNWRVRRTVLLAHFRLEKLEAKPTASTPNSAVASSSASSSPSPFSSSSSVLTEGADQPLKRQCTRICEDPGSDRQLACGYMDEAIDIEEVSEDQTTTTDDCIEAVTLEVPLRRHDLLNFVRHQEIVQNIVAFL
jgi:ankyrin repeat protein